MKLKYLMHCLAFFALAFSCFQALAQPTKGLLAHYKFNNSYKDATGNRNDGMAIGSMSFVEDRYGNKCSAAGFNGTGYVQVPSSPSLNTPSQEITIAAWVMADFGGINTPDLMWFSICSKGNTSTETANVPHYRLQMTSRTISLNTEYTENIDQFITPGVWYHCAQVYTGTDVLLYINGEYVFTFPYSGTLYPNNEPLEIGRDVPGSLEFHYGAIDDLRIYKNALNYKDIFALYQDNSESMGTGALCPTANPPVVTNNPTTPPVTKNTPVVVTKRDTVYQNKIDTVYQKQVVQKVDTVYKKQVVVQNKVDTVYQKQVVQKIDTVYQKQVVVQNKVDTVYKKQVVVKVDTVYQKKTVTVGSIDISKDVFTLDNVYFERSQPTLLAESYPQLNDLVATLQQNPSVQIRLEGHTDNVGDPNKNMSLSQKRVEVVKNYLVNRNIAEYRITVKAFGQTQPLNDNSTEDLRKVNRRVEVRITKR